MVQMMERHRLVWMWVLVMVESLVQRKVSCWDVRMMKGNKRGTMCTACMLGSSSRHRRRVMECILQMVCYWALLLALM